MGNSVRLDLQTVEGSGLRFVARVEEGFELTLDSGPGRQAVNPVENLLVALGGCTGMDVIGILRKQRQQVTSYEVLVRGDRRAEHPRVFTRIEVVHRIHGRDLSPTAIERAIELSDTTYCTVHAMLAAGVELVSRYEIVPA